MRPLNKNQSRYLAIGLLILCLIGVVLAVYVPVSLQQRHYDDSIASRTDYLTRYQRIIAAGDEIQAALDQVKRTDWRKHFLKNTGAALAASEIQEIAKNLIDANGGKLISMQIAPSKDEGGFRRISVNVQLTGNMTALRQILYSVETMKPYLLVDNINIRTQANYAFKRAPDGAPPDIMVGFDLSGYTFAVDEK